VRLSGSGPTLFVLFPETQENKARGLYESLEGEGLRAFLVGTGVKRETDS
jgi:homoserine kinase